MATQILNLPLLSFPMTVATNEDWLDSWAYLDPSGSALTLAGLTLNMMLRPTPASFNSPVIASTATTVASLPVNGAIITGGVGGNVLSLRILRATMGSVVPGTYVFEVQAQGDGQTRTIATGAVTIVQGIVR